MSGDCFCRGCGRPIYPGCGLCTACKEYAQRRAVRELQKLNDDALNRGVPTPTTGQVWIHRGNGHSYVFDKSNIPGAGTLRDRLFHLYQCLQTGAYYLRDAYEWARESDSFYLLEEKP